MQAALDTVLSRASPEARQRFEELSASPLLVPATEPLAEWNTESWVDDLDRARRYADRQSFALASRLVERWLGCADRTALDQNGLYLKGRTLTLLGDLQRDQGELTGPGSARAA
jgi:hypothetical protein